MGAKRQQTYHYSKKDKINFNSSHYINCSVFCILFSSLFVTVLKAVGRFVAVID